ncbi:MAG: 7-cyano-7-deazaguanine synthase [Candidatus Binataceae bacterium]|jgi:7-cyano-7-deazaguanine synthase
MDRIAVLASGGLDSSILIAGQARNAEVYPIYVQWGFPWEVSERESLEAFLSALKSSNVKPPAIISVPIKAVYGDHWSLSGNKVPGADEPDSAVFLPGRNILLIGLAAVWCSTHEVSRIAIGSLRGNPFPDATPEFFENFAGILSTGLGHRIMVEAPYRGLTKSDIIRQFRDLPLELTLTCMTPKPGKHCGQCNKCGERRRAFLESGVPDRTIYSG